MAVAGETKGPKADRAVDGQSPWDFAEVVVAPRVEVAARVRQDVRVAKTAAIEFAGDR